MSEENSLRSDNRKVHETSRTEECSNRDSESRDQEKHRDSSTEQHSRPEKYPRKEGEQMQSVQYSLILWKYLSVWINAQEPSFRQNVDEMIEYLRNNPDSVSLATNSHDRNLPTLPSCLSNNVPKLIIEDKDSKEDYNPSSVQDKDPVAPGPSRLNSDVCCKGKSGKAECIHSTFEPPVTIGCSKNSPQKLFVDPSVDTVPIYQSTIQETENGSFIFGDALAFADPSRFIGAEKPHKCEKCGKTFSKKTYFRSHDKRCGLTDKKYACGECHKKYSRKQNLDIHYRKHTGEHPTCARSVE